MFTYLDAEPHRPSLEELFDDYWTLMPSYQGVKLEDLEVGTTHILPFPTHSDGTGLNNQRNALGTIRNLCSFKEALPVECLHGAELMAGKEGTTPQIAMLFLCHKSKGSFADAFGLCVSGSETCVWVLSHLPRLSSAPRLGSSPSGTC